MFISDNFSGNKISYNGKEYLFFSGTSYLGINHNQQFTEYIHEGLKKYGNNYGSSRNSNFRLKIYEEAEVRLAACTGAPAAVTVSSGFLAGQLLVNTFRNKARFVYAPDAHPAVCLEASDFYSGDFNSWQASVADQISQMPEGDIIIVCNSVDPLYCSHYDFSWTQTLPGNKNFMLIIDDSHGLGITGTRGSGIYKQIQCNSNVKLAVVSSLAKAMGIPGGVILGSYDIIELIKQTAFFSSASPISPAYLHAYTKSDAIYSIAYQNLLNNIFFFEQQLMSSTNIFKGIAGYPVFYTNQSVLNEFLSKNRILISSFAYPTLTSPIINRVILNAAHTKNDIQTLSCCIRKFVQKNNNEALLSYDQNIAFPL